MRNRWLRLAVLLFSTTLGCGSEPQPKDDFSVPEGCNPIAADWDCMLPFPSDHFRTDDSSMPSGKRVVFSSQALERAGGKEPIDMLSMHPVDGYSLGTQILALFPGGIDDSNLVTATGDFSRTLGTDSPTALFEADTGKFVPHLAELDPRAPEDSRRALILRPLVRLQGNTRYVVAIRSLRDKAGKAIPPPEGFRRIRDGEAAGTARLAELAARYETELFPQLASAGIDRGSLQLAWDFTTVTEDMLTRDMVAVRGGVMEKLSMGAPSITVTSVQDDVNAHIFRRIDATMSVPAYLESDKPGASLARNADGDVTAKGEFDVPFTVWIPRSVANRAPGDPPARLLQFGHGFFGSREEAAGSFVSEFADELGFVVVAADWWGMSDVDRLPVGDAITGNPSETMRFTDRVHQAMANFIALGEVATGPLAALPEAQVGPAPTFDTQNLYFYGISQGAILGGTFMSLSPRIQRGTLSVGGANFSLMMYRARPFLAFLLVIGSVIPDPLDQQKFAAMTQSSFDRVDPLTYAPHVVKEPFSASPMDRRVLLQIGIGDTAVPNLASHLFARALGVVHLQPAPRAISFLETAEGPIEGSAITEFDFGIDPLPGATATPAGEDNEVHEGVRRLGASKAQIDGFFQPQGFIVNPCAGACDPE